MEMEGIWHICKSAYSSLSSKTDGPCVKGTSEGGRQDTRDSSEGV